MNASLPPPTMPIRSFLFISLVFKSFTLQV
jgi:hypothetical protein